MNDASERFNSQPNFEWRKGLLYVFCDDFDVFGSFWEEINGHDGSSFIPLVHTIHHEFHKVNESV